MKIVWSANAKQRLIEILDYISVDNPEAALSLIELIEDSVSKLIQSPFAGRQIPEISNTTIRELVVHTNYGVIYEVSETQIVILTIRHFKKQFP